jgi:hypothetical protein
MISGGPYVLCSDRSGIILLSIAEVIGRVPDTTL